MSASKPSETIVASQWFANRDAGADLGVRGASLVRLHCVLEARGELDVGEVGREVPFPPQRFFVISGVPDEHIRGEHAHREQRQFLVCLAGSVTADVDDGSRRRSVILDCPRVGVSMQSMVWGAQHHYSRDAVLLVLASAPYDAADYIREYGEFLALPGRGR